MEPMKVAQELWDRVQARDWVGLGELLADDLVVDWPVSRERIVGRENYVAVNAEYPEGWAINVLRIVADGEVVVSEVEVPHETMGEIFRVASFWTVQGGKVVDGREYWTSLGSDPSPEWRAAYVQRV
jgi:ketosteroid isomerase-like protein